MRNMKHIKITNEESNKLVGLLNQKDNLNRRYELIETLEQIGYTQNFKDRSTSNIIKFARSCVKANRTNANNLVTACSYDTTVAVSATDTSTSKEEMVSTIKNYFKTGNLAVDALKIINGERQDTYGNPEDSFSSIANVWKWYFKSMYNINICITPKDVAIMMTLLKMARECNQNKEDNIIDAIGYLALAGDMKD